jgi:hypothetical protein
MPGASQQVTVIIDPLASSHPLSYWAPANNAPEPGWANGSWKMATGNYTISVGGSSADTPLTQSITLSDTLIPATPAGSCTSVQPLTDWVCVNGGWLPPGTSVGGATTSPASPPGLLTAAGPYVGKARNSLRRGEPQFVQALSEFLLEAERVLVIPPVSVMDKPVTPPSGDKHDYMSQAPFWWPDPSKKNGLPYLRRDGQRNPEVDKITDHANLFQVASAVRTLGLAYYFTGREDYAQHTAAFVRAWFLDPATRMNPNLNFAQGIPGRFKGRPEGIIESRRFGPILDGLALLQGSPAWTAADDQGLKDWMRAYLQWLLNSPNGLEEAVSGNNQETWYDLQVVRLALYTNQPEVARGIFAKLPTAIDHQVEPDGKQPQELAREDAWHYSIFNLVPLLELAYIGKGMGIDLWNYQAADGSSLRAAVEFLIPFATGEKPFPFQKPGGGTAPPAELQPALRWAGVVANDPRYQNLAQQVGGATPTLDLTLP